MTPDPSLHWCRTYWGHCGCDLARDHAGPHIGLHLNDEETVVLASHVIPHDYENTFGEDATPKGQADESAG